MQGTRPWALARNEIPGECGSLPVGQRIVNDGGASLTRVHLVGRIRDATSPQMFGRLAWEKGCRQERR